MFKTIKGWIREWLRGPVVEAIMMVDMKDQLTWEKTLAIRQLIVDTHGIPVAMHQIQAYSMGDEPEETLEPGCVAIIFKHLGRLGTENLLSRQVWKFE